MSHAQNYLAEANRHIAELTVQIARQRVIVKYALDTGQRSQMAESLLDALEGSLRIFEKHRISLLSLQRQPSEQADNLSAPTRRIGGNDGPGLVTTQPGSARHDQLTRPPAVIIAQQIKVMAVVRYRAGQAIDKFETVNRNRGLNVLCARPTDGAQ